MAALQSNSLFFFFAFAYKGEDSAFCLDMEAMSSLDIEQSGSVAKTQDNDNFPRILLLLF